jgi:hypothetical protein
MVNTNPVLTVAFARVFASVSRLYVGYNSRVSFYRPRLSKSTPKMPRRLHILTYPEFPDILAASKPAGRAARQLTSAGVSFRNYALDIVGNMGNFPSRWQRALIAFSYRAAWR